MKRYQRNANKEKETKALLMRVKMNFMLALSKQNESGI